MKKVHRIIKFNHKAWLNNFYLSEDGFKKKENNEFEKDFFKLMNKVVFRKTMENVRKHGDIKFATSEKRRNCLVSEPN